MMRTLGGPARLGAALLAAGLAAIPALGSETISYGYDAQGRLVTTTFSGRQYSGESVGPLDLASWWYSGVTRSGAGLLGGEPAFQYTVQTTGTWSAIALGSGASAGETFSFAFTLQAVSGSTDQQYLGLYGNTTGWTSSTSTARIVSGPGTLTQVGGGLWSVSGLSTSQPTRVEVTRTYTQAEGIGAYLYVDLLYGHRAGQSLIAGQPRFGKASTSQVDQFCYDAAGNRTLVVSNSTGGATCP